MSAASKIATSHAPSADKTLRKLFLTLFLRGRSSRGLYQKSAPRFTAMKLKFVLFFYGLFGLFALALIHQPLFALSVYLHGATFMLVGMFVASSCGEMLFNKDEAEILLHRPITAGSLLRAKILVLVQVSLWMAGAFNAAGFFVGALRHDGSWLFPIAHAISTCLEAVFCASSVVVAYQLCLRLFGRERLDGLMTTVQVIVSIAIVTAGQVLPRMLPSLDKVGDISATWWISILPPAWFAGLDELLLGYFALSWILMSLAGVAATAGLFFVACKILAQDYEFGLQKLGSTVSLRKTGAARRQQKFSILKAPLGWLLRDPAERVAFKLCATYMVRDRDVRLRLYPGLAPSFIMPVIFLVQSRFGGFSLVFAGAFLALIPATAVTLLRYSQQWQASDFFRLAPLDGPAALCHGMRQAAIWLLGAPAFAIFGAITWFIIRDTASLLLLLPGLITVPAYTLIACRNGDAVPFSLPTEEARPAGRGLMVFVSFLASFVIAGLAYFAHEMHWFGWFMAVESAVMIALYFALRSEVDASLWRSIE